jgi:hypothetical protein
MSRMGRATEMITEFTGYERPRRLASSTHVSAMEIEGSLTFDPVPEGTRMGWSWKLEPRGVLRLMSLLVARMGPLASRRGGHTNGHRIVSPLFSFDHRAVSTPKRAQHRRELRRRRAGLAARGAVWLLRRHRVSVSFTSRFHRSSTCAWIASISAAVRWLNRP